MRKWWTIFLYVPLFAGCDTERIFKGPDHYDDGFEAYASAEELIDGRDLRWSFDQVTLEGNAYFLDTAVVHSGKNSIRFEGQATSEGGRLSKCSVVKQKMAFREGERVYLSAWFYLAGQESFDWLFIADLEEQTAIGAGPGMRLALVEDQVRVEHKFNEPDIVQDSSTAVLFPREQWVQLEWEVLLSQKEKGSVRVWQDGALILTAEGRRTLPEDVLYFQQGTKGMYSSVEFGITANPTDVVIVLYVDDVSVRVLP